MQKNDLISIIVAVYNGEKYLRQCIKSIINQTYRNLEIIVIDDGSTDDSPNICDEWAKKDNRIKVIHQTNQGVSKSRNNALEIASGKYVSFIDQDDFVDNNYILYLYSILKEFNAEIATISNVVLYTKNKSFYMDNKIDNKKECLNGKKVACNMLYSKMEIGPWNKIISRDLLEKNNIRFCNELFGGEGYLFSVEAFSKANRIAVGYKGLYYYRVDNSNSEMSRYRSRTFYSSLRAIEIMMDKFKNDKIIYKAVKYAEWRVYVAYLHALVASNSENENKEDLNVLKKNSKKLAYRNIYAPIPVKRKIKELLYLISPMLVIRYDLRKKTIREFNQQ